MPYSIEIFEQIAMANEALDQGALEAPKGVNAGIFDYIRTARAESQKNTNESTVPAEVAA